MTDATARAQAVQPGLRHHLLFMAGSALALLTLLALLRLALLLFNRELLGDASLATLLEGFGNGLRFDLRVLVYIFVPLSLAVLSPRAMAARRLQRVWLTACASLAILLGVIELNFYQEFHQRLNALVFQYLGEDPATVLSMLWHGFPVVTLLSVWGGLTLVWALLLRWLDGRCRPRGVSQMRRSPTRPPLAWHWRGATLLVLVLISVVAARGTLRQGPPLRWGDAFTTDSVFINQLGLNPALTLYEAAKNRYSDHRDNAWEAVLPEDEALAAVELAGAIRRSRLEHLHAHFGSIAADVARLAARLTGITYSFTAHAKDIFHEEVVPAELATKLREAHTTVTVSEFNKAHLRREFGRDADRVVRLYNSVDLEAFPFGTKGAATGPARIAAVGRLVEKKGFGDLLTALASLVGEGRDVHLDLVGTGPLEATLVEQVRELGLTEHVTMHGALPQSRVREIVAEAAVFAAPCVIGADGNRDGLPTVLLEALALGTPSVSTPVTGIPEIVRHEETGLLVPEADPGALAAAVARTLDEHDELALALVGLGRDPRHAVRDLAGPAGEVEGALAGEHDLDRARGLLGEQVVGDGAAHE